jgi:hypothetical protein
VVTFRIESHGDDLIGRAAGGFEAGKLNRVWTGRYIETHLVFRIFHGTTRHRSKARQTVIFDGPERSTVGGGRISGQRTNRKPVPHSVTGFFSENQSFQREKSDRVLAADRTRRKRLLHPILADRRKRPGQLQ